MAFSASEVIAADVEEDRMTCRNGCSNDGVSKDRMSIAHVSSFFSCTNR